MVLKYDYTTTIVVAKRTDDYHAFIKGRPEIWGCGEDRNKAIGDLIMSNEAEFGIKVQYGRKENKYGIYVLRCSNCGFMKYAGISPTLDMMSPDIGTSDEVIDHFDVTSKCCEKPRYLIED